MMTNNKVLTVSYGTFSCTLEGFEDSFGTMKAITEYFRDLTSDDRYFGAEPVQPDAEMLAQIAQKEISRRVQAREHQGNIVLSAEPADTPYTAIAAASATAAAAGAVIEEAQEPQTPNNDAAEEADASTDEVIAAVVDADAADIPAEDTAQTAGAATPVEEKTHGVPANEDYLDDQSESAEADPSIAVMRRAQATAQAQPSAEMDIVPDRDDAAVSSFFAQNGVDQNLYEEAEDVVETAQPAATEKDVPAQDETVAEVADEAAEPVETSSAAQAAPIAAATVAAATKTESIADKLKRIREVVAQNSDAEEAEEIEEAQEGAAQSADDGVVAASIDDAAPADQDDIISSALRDIKGAMDTDDQQEVTNAAQEAQPETTDDSDLTDILDRLKLDTQETQAEDVEPQEVETPEPAAQDLVKDENAEGKAAEAQQAQATEGDPAALRPRRARVIKVKRVDLENAINQGDLEEVSQTDDTIAEPKTSSLSPQDEAELAEELAALEADLEAVEETTAQDTPDFAEPESDAVQEAEQTVSSAREALPSLDETQNPDMERLMDETDQQMSEPENATRRNAFAHLRAAVAAKKADVALGGNQDDESEGDAYREDLAEVVRPRRPVSGEQRTPRPSASRPAPLKLVAEQRIDNDKPADAAPVRPRRVAAVQEEADVQAEESFAEFAAEAGATSLPDLLEAAAAYMSFVEGRAQFSRPQLMNKVRQVEQNGFTREDSLRLFGKLLRDGKIEKTNAGRFQVSDQIGFKPDARAAG